jgi:DNA-binding NtrC family response regulator
MKNILVVGNDFQPGVGLHRLLNKSGYRVITESDSHAMVFLLAAGMPVDLVIMDDLTVDMDCRDSLGYVRQVAPHIPVIVLSAHSSIEKYLQAMSLGAYEYLNKPVADHEIIRIVQAATDAPQNMIFFAAAA